MHRIRAIKFIPFIHQSNILVLGGIFTLISVLIKVRVGIMVRTYKNRVINVTITIKRARGMFF